MKLYFIKTNATNEVVFVENGIGKVIELAPSGIFEGVVDVYDDNAAEDLKAFARRSDFNGFDEINGYEFPFDENEFEECVLIADIE